MERKVKEFHFRLHLYTNCGQRREVESLLFFWVGISWSRSTLHASYTALCFQNWSHRDSMSLASHWAQLRRATVGGQGRGEEVARPLMPLVQDELAPSREGHFYARGLSPFRSVDCFLPFLLATQVVDSSSVIYYTLCSPTPILPLLVVLLCQ